MRRPMPTAALALALALAGAIVVACAACAPHPIVARDPVPAPTGAESFVCGTYRFPLNAAAADCTPRTREERMILRSRG